MVRERKRLCKEFFMLNDYLEQVEFDSSNPELHWP